MYVLLRTGMTTRDEHRGTVESKRHFKPKCVLVLLPVVFVVFVLLASRSYINNFKWRGFVLSGINNTSPIIAVVSLARPESNTSNSDRSHGEMLTVDFDPHGNDTLVVIHTQKTGGSAFVKHLVALQRDGEYLCLLDPEVKKTIRKRRKIPKGKRSTRHHQSPCPRDPAKPDGEQWLIATKTVRWVCGLHASYSEFRSCLPALSNPKINSHRRLHYAILLRHPVMRYLSEYLHIQRNATWSVQRTCDNRLVSVSEMPPCYPGYYAGKPWVNVTLSSFVSCDSNWGNNRQTMMLADLESVHCFNKSALSIAERDERLLETAKNNLKSFAFLGLTEFMAETCQLFEKTFDMTFSVTPAPYNSLSEFRSGPLLVLLRNNTELYRAILRRNHLDIQLYAFAMDLFVERTSRAQIPVNPDFVEDEVRRLSSHPSEMDHFVGKRKGLNYTVT